MFKEQQHFRRKFPIVKRKRLNLVWLLKEFWTCHPKICCFSIVFILSWRHLKTTDAGRDFSLNSPYLPKESPQKNSVVINLLLGPDSSQGHRLKVDSTSRQTLLQIIISPISSFNGPFIFTKNHLLSPKLPIFLPLSRQYTISQISLLFWLFTFFSCDASVCILKINKFVYLFSY